MALRKLAGPFYITKSSDGLLAGPVTSYFWVPNIGLVIWVNSEYGLQICSYDGYSVLYADTVNPGLTVGYNHDESKLLLITPGGPEWKCDRRSLMPFRGQEVVPNIWLRYFRYFSWKGRRFGAIWNFPSSTIDEVLADGTPIPYATMPFTQANLKAGRHTNEAYVQETVGGNRFCFFDLETKTFTPTRTIGAAGDSHYLPEYDVILVVNETEGFIEIYSMETLPENISAPVLIAGQNKAGIVATYRTQVTGAEGDPCPGEVVLWSLTGKGRLLNTTSTTDASGYATCKVRYGFNDDGTTIVTAGLVC